MTEKTLDWLNHNRFIAYPFVNDDGLVVDGTRVPDCILLDCLVVDTRHRQQSELIFTEFSVTANNTRVKFKYAGESFTYTLPASSTPDGIIKVEGTSVSGLDNEYLYIKFIFSSHAYILEHVGTGTWKFTGKIAPSKVISVPASGVSGLETNGSAYVAGYSAANTATGDVHLVDGYRTQPVIQNGRVLVKVGTHYGEDPCHYVDGDDQEVKKVVCDDLMLFFCGQNATNSGNVMITGGPGVNVQQGRMYTAHRDIIDTYGEIGVHVGESIPCIEITATSELMQLYRPSES